MADADRFSLFTEVRERLGGSLVRGLHAAIPEIASALERSAGQAGNLAERRVLLEAADALRIETASRGQRALSRLYDLTFTMLEANQGESDQRAPSSRLPGLVADPGLAALVDEIAARVEARLGIGYGVASRRVDALTRTRSAPACLPLGARVLAAAAVESLRPQAVDRVAGAPLRSMTAERLAPRLAAAIAEADRWLAEQGVEPWPVDPEAERADGSDDEPGREASPGSAGPRAGNVDFGPRSPPVEGQAVRSDGEPVRMAADEAVEPDLGPVLEGREEPVAELAQQASRESGATPESDTAPEPEAMPTPEPEATPTPEPEATPTFESTPRPEAVLASERIPEPVSTSGTGAPAEPGAMQSIESASPASAVVADEAPLERAAETLVHATVVADVLGCQPLAPGAVESGYRHAARLPRPEALEQDAVAFAHHVGVLPYTRAARQRYFERLRRRMLAAAVPPGQLAALDLVAAMFDYIIDDARMPAAAQPLLWRLQHPAVALAALDAGFLGDDRRSIRRLVENIAAISTAYADDMVQGSELFRRMETVVRAVEIVSHAFASRSSVLGEQVRREYARAAQGVSQLVARIAKERSALESTPGRRNRRDFARRPSREREQAVTRRLEGELLDRLARCEVPESAREFLMGVWLRHLRTAVLRDGEDSASYRLALQVVDDLLWSLDASGPRQSRRQLATRIPPLIRLLTQGVSDIGAKPEEFRPFLDELFLIHLRKMQKVPREAGGTVPGPGPSTAGPAALASVPAEAAPPVTVPRDPSPPSSGPVEAGPTDAATRGDPSPSGPDTEIDGPLPTLEERLPDLPPEDESQTPRWGIGPRAGEGAVVVRRLTPFGPPPDPPPRDPDRTGMDWPSGPSDAGSAMHRVADGPGRGAERSEGGAPGPTPAPEHDAHHDDGGAATPAAGESERSGDQRLLSVLSTLDLSDYPSPARRQSLAADEALARLRRGDWLELVGRDGQPQDVKVAWINARRTVVLLVRRPDRRALSLRAAELLQRFEQGKATLLA